MPDRNARGVALTEAESPLEDELRVQLPCDGGQDASESSFINNIPCNEKRLINIYHFRKKGGGGEKGEKNVLVNAYPQVKNASS